MLKVDEAEARAGALVEAARKGGSDAADVLYAAEASLGISVRLGELEDVGRSEGEEIGLRVFIGQRSATVSSSDLSPGALGELVERAIAMAREAPEDPYAGLAPEERLIQGSGPDVEGDDGDDPSPAALKARAIEMDETRGLMKVVVDAGTGLLLGAAVLGVEGGELASVLQMAMVGRLPYTVLRDMVFPHPTFAESLNNLFAQLD